MRTSQQGLLNTPTAFLPRGENGYDAKQSDGEAPEILELWVMRHRVISMDQIELNCLRTQN